MEQERNFRNRMLSRVQPGWSWTQGNNPWANPPKYTDVNDAVQEVIDNLKNTDRRNKVVAFIAAGVPVSTLGRTIARTGFSKNLYNPDVAELMQPAVNTYLTSIALEELGNAPFRLTPEDPAQTEMDEADMSVRLMRLMEEENPSLARAIYDHSDEIEEQRLADIRKLEDEQQRARLSEQDIKTANKAVGFATKREESK